MHIADSLQRHGVFRKLKLKLEQDLNVNSRAPERQTALGNRLPTARNKGLPAEFREVCRDRGVAEWTASLEPGGRDRAMGRRIFQHIREPVLCRFVLFLISYSEVMG
jgi:hypothetical protein